uniref:RING-type domain-containing protein n=1 Tax=Plectus sambesii TaxID=2011161 RepID=A0A914XE56_9BILA
MNTVDDIEDDDLLVVIDDSEPGAAPLATGQQQSHSPNASMNDALARIRQMEEDERLARQLQEEMDREEALAVLNGSSNSPEIVADLEEVARIAVADSQQRRPRIGLAQGPGARRAVPQGAIRAARIRRQPVDETFVVPNVELVDLVDSVGPSTTGRRRLMAGSTARRTALAFPFILGGQAPRRRPAAAPVGLGGRSLEAQRLRALVSQLVSNMDDSLNQSYETMLDLVERIGEVQKDGLSKEEIGRLPTVIFRAKEATDDTTCIVCMTDYKNQEKLRLLPCKHRFHKNCIDRWLANKHNCPICRADAHAPVNDVVDHNEASSSSSSSSLN